MINYESPKLYQQKKTRKGIASSGPQAQYCGYECRKKEEEKLWRVKRIRRECCMHGD